MTNQTNSNAASMHPIVIRLRELANAFKMWRVRDKTDGSYCIEFEEWEKREAEEWFAEHAAKNPDRFANRELALVIVKSEQSRLAIEAADLLELLIDQTMRLTTPYPES